MKTALLLFICFSASSFIYAQHLQVDNFTLGTNNIQQHKEQQFSKNLSKHSSLTPFTSNDQHIDNQTFSTTFSIQKQLPHYIVGGLSLGAVGFGFIQKGKSQDIYDNQYLTETGRIRAEPSYQEANDLHHQFIWLTAAVGGAFIINATWYLIRKSKIENGVSSNIEITPSASGTIGAGVSLKF